MLKKEMVVKQADAGHMQMTVEKIFKPVGDMDQYHAGWSEGSFGSVNTTPYWKTGGANRMLKSIYCTWQFDSLPASTTVKKEKDRDYMGSLEIEINGTKVACNIDGITQTVSIEGDPFNLYGSIGKTVSVKFTSPQTGITKKVKQVFTRSQKEGVVNAWERDAAKSTGYCSVHIYLPEQIRRRGLCNDHVQQGRSVQYAHPYRHRVQSYKLALCSQVRRGNNTNKDSHRLGYLICRRNGGLPSYGKLGTCRRSSTCCKRKLLLVSNPRECFVPDSFGIDTCNIKSYAMEVFYAA